MIRPSHGLAPRSVEPSPSRPFPQSSPAAPKALGLRSALWEGVRATPRAGSADASNRCLVIWP